MGSSYAFLLLLLLLPSCYLGPALGAVPRAVRLYRNRQSVDPGSSSVFGQSLELVTMPPLLLPYRDGPLLSGDRTGKISVYILWYGAFTPAQQAIVTDFFHSLDSPSGAVAAAPGTVGAWWRTVTHYRDVAGTPVASSVRLAGESFDAACSLGKKLKTTDVESLLSSAVHRRRFPASAAAVYLALTAADVYVDGFCMSSCGYHAYSFPSRAAGERMLPYAWVGNAAKQCPGQCAWPFAAFEFGPPTPPLTPPNGDMGVDGMVVNIATVLAGAATNPFDTGYFQGDASEPLEAVSACAGIFGKGAYPGYPGELLVHNSSGASYNAKGVNNRHFLLPAIWNPASLTCSTLA